MKLAIKMKRAIIIAVLAFVAFATAQGQKLGGDVIKPQEPEMVTVYDTTIVADMKLAVIQDRLFGKYGMVTTLEQVISEEKAATGEISNIQSVQVFVNALQDDYDRLITAFQKVDTVKVLKADVQAQIQELTQWVERVVNDEEIKNETSLSIWEENVKKLQKLNSYQKQILQKKK